jgi:2'-5' RNA ligase
MAQSGFVVFVPEADKRVSAWRSLHDPSARLGVAAHVTLLFPFMAPDAIDAAVIERAARVLRAFSPVDFALERVGRFAATAWLAPEPAASFVALTQALVQEFPQHLPFEGAHAAVVPHLTVAHGNESDAIAVAAELERDLRVTGPIRSRCSSVALIENRSGRFLPMCELVLGSLSPGAGSHIGDGVAASPRR